MNEEAMNEWDLFEVLAERAQPTSHVSIYLNEVASYAKGELIKQKLATPDKEVSIIEALDEKIAEAEELLAKSRYVVYLTAIPSRMREDFASKAMHKFPLKLNIMGQDDPENSLDRQKYNNELLWHAQIIAIENPEGKTNTQFTLEQIVQFGDALPTAAWKAIDTAIGNLTKDAEKFTADSQNLDF